MSDQCAEVTDPDLKVAAEVGSPGLRLEFDQQCRWRALADAYLIGYDRHPDRLLVTYEARPPVREEVSDLIRVAEQSSPFLTWIMVDDAQGLTILIQGNEQLVNEVDVIVCNARTIRG